LRGDRGLFAVYLLLIAWMPVPLGSNRAWSWSLAEVVIYLLAAAWLAGYLLRRRWGHGRAGDVVPPFSLEAVANARVVMVLWLSWLAVVSLYLFTWPVGIVEQISPETHRTWMLASGPQSGVTRLHLSLSPYDSAVFWYKSVAWVLLFALTLVLVRSRRRIRWLAVTIVAAGLVQAVWGGMEALTTRSGIATGGYVNRNHLAGFLEMSLAVGIGLLIAQLGGTSVKGWRNRLGALFDLLLSPKAILRLSLVIMVIALVLTRSRMGNIAFFSSLLVAGSIALVLSRHATRSTVILIASLLVVDVFLVGAWFGVDRVVERIEQTVEKADIASGDIGDDRQLAYAHATTLVADYPALGAGPGSFHAVFPRYSGADVGGFYDHAHNDYLQFAAETGWIGLGLLGLIVVLSLAEALRAQYRRHDPLMRGMAFAAVMGIVALLIHSWVDFNLQIPANSALFTVLLALAWISSRLGRHDRRLLQSGERP